jgi:hypothetical protein
MARNVSLDQIYRPAADSTSDREIHALTIEKEHPVAAGIEHRLSELGFAFLDRAATGEQAVSFARAQARPVIPNRVGRTRGGEGPEPQP